MELLKLLIIAFLFIFQNVFSQNLVLNPGFEEYTQLPHFYTELKTYFCKYWFLPDESSPDYYHRDSKEPKLGVPNNRFGYYPAKSGNGYIGIYSLSWDGYMEHLTGTLKEPLQQGKKYKVSFYICFAGNYCHFFASNIGIHFSSDIFPLMHSTPFYEEILDPEIKADVKEESWVKDTSWQLMQWAYIAKGGERYLTLGIFYEDKWKMEKKISEFIHLKQNSRKKTKFYKDNQNILLINPNYIPNDEIGDNNSYYFIDDVSVELDTTVNHSGIP